MSNPQVPPPASSAGGTIDFGRAFAFVFDDPDWLKKVLIGGLMSLLSLLLIGIFFVFGYCARLARNVAAGAARPLPEWDRWGDDFGEGVKLFVITLVFYIPAIVVFVIGIGGAAAAGGFEDTSEAAGVAGGLFASGTMCLGWLIVLVIALILPAALTFAVMKQSFGAAFEFGRIFAYIKANAVNYLLSIVVYLVANFIAQFGVILLCVGLFFTTFWMYLAATFAFSDTYARSPVK